MGSEAINFRNITKIQPYFLKIDISIVRSIHSTVLKQRVLRVVLDFYRGLKTGVIAEGVEKKEEYKYLLRKVVHDHGFLFGRPDSVLVVRFP